MTRQTKPKLGKRRRRRAESRPVRAPWDWDHSPKQVAKWIGQKQLITLADVLEKPGCRQAFQILCKPHGKYPGFDPNWLGPRLLSFGNFRPGHNRVFFVSSFEMRKLRTLPRKLRLLAEEMWGPDLRSEQIDAAREERFRAGFKSFMYTPPEGYPLRLLMLSTPGYSWPKDLADLPDRMREAAAVIESELLGKPHFRADNAQAIRVWYLVDETKKATGRPHYEELQTLLDGVLDVWNLPERIGSARYLSVIFDRRAKQQRARAKQSSSPKKPAL